MTRVTVVVRVKVCGNRKPRASIDGRVVATDAAGLWTGRAGIVLRVIELDVERFVEACREILERRIATADVGMADHAHRDRGRSELAAMTVSAGLVTGKAWRCSVIGPFVTRVAGEGTVPLTVV